MLSDKQGQGDGPGLAPSQDKLPVTAADLEKSRKRAKKREKARKKEKIEQQKQQWAEGANANVNEAGTGDPAQQGDRSWSGLLSGTQARYEDGKSPLQSWSPSPTLQHTASMAFQTTPPTSADPTQ
ncbi:hypothetical protein FRB94_011306 [Tulasnella sp. JGI-2019a]|nr:hypothetical protein FRB93_012165 [Tulasnella sp. JGI-2019a]KAG8992769.1 hypothetical protein FRB94_011306 [Tulasnella sp. JGI-2019a]KAG9021716.1 hypothetical protein FRB95_001596 [Tulasnella sp. JGI-2019a]